MGGSSRRSSLCLPHPRRLGFLVVMEACSAVAHSVEGVAEVKAKARGNEVGAVAVALLPSAVVVAGAAVVPRPPLVPLPLWRGRSFHEGRGPLVW